MAVACSITESNLDAFQFEELQATITITDEKGKKKEEAKCSADGTVKLQAMIPGTITVTDEKGKKTWEAKCSTDVDAMIQTKHNGQGKVELTMDLTKMIKFKCGDEEKHMCNVFSVNTGRSKTVQFLWNDVTERYEKRKSKETTDTPDNDKVTAPKQSDENSQTTDTPDNDEVDEDETMGNHKSKDTAPKQSDEDSLSNGATTGERNNTNTTLLNNVTEPDKKGKVKKRKRHGKGKRKKRKRNGLVTPPCSQEEKASHSQEQNRSRFGYCPTPTTRGSHGLFGPHTDTSTTPGSHGLLGPHPVTQDEGS